jgi:hypothetical protein
MYIFIFPFLSSGFLHAWSWKRGDLCYLKSAILLKIICSNSKLKKPNIKEGLSANVQKGAVIPRQGKHWVSKQDNDWPMGSSEEAHKQDLLQKEDDGEWGRIDQGNWGTENSSQKFTNKHWLMSSSIRTIDAIFFLFALSFALPQQAATFSKKGKKSISLPSTLPTCPKVISVL